MRNADGSTAKVDLMGAARIIEGLEMLGFDEDKDSDAYWRASDALDKIITGAASEERERVIRIVDEMCGSHNITKRLRERVGAAT